MDLRDLNKSVANMSDDELEAMVFEIRKRRRTPPRKPIREKKGTPKKKSSAELINAMSKEEKLALLTKLKGEQ